MTVFSREDQFEDDYLFLKKKIGEFSTLYFSRAYHAHPFSHKESRFEREERENFNFEHWDIIAAEFNGEGVTGYSSVFLIHKENKEYGLVIELTGFQLIEGVFGDWSIEVNGEDNSSKDVLDYFGYKEKKNVNEKVEIEAKRIDVEAPSFVPMGKKPGRIDGVPYLEKKSAIEPRKEAKAAPYVPDFDSHIEEEDDEEEESPYVAPAIVRPAFEAHSNKKPGKISNDFRAKRNEIPEEPLHVEVSSGPFVATSSRKPKNLNDDRSSWRSIPLYRYRSNISNPGERNLVFDYGDESVLAYFEKMRETLGKFNQLTTIDSCVFSPSAPSDGFPQRKYFKNFDINEWNILSMNISSYNVPITALISRKDNPKFCAVVAPKGIVYAVGFEGISVTGASYYSLDALLKRLEKPRPKFIESEVVTPVVKPKPVKEADYAEKKAVSLKPRRRVFVSSSFVKDEERFIDKYHAQAKEDFDETIRAFITYTDEEIDAFLKGKDAKKIRERNGVAIWKFRFGSSREYVASRLFYARGYDLERKMGPSDFLFLGLSDQGEHDEQTEVSALFARMFDSPNDLVLYQRLLPAVDEGNLDQIAYMSRRQFSFLEEARSSMPMAFLGAAGTGKTLLSLQHYISLSEEGKKVLYLTYQKSLCDEVRLKLKELGAESVEALTYRDLCYSIFGDEAKEMRTKKRFRKWFISYTNKTGPIQSKLRQVGPTIEDQFMICYVFYRGIIDGSLKGYEHRSGGILSKEDFLDEVRNEEGFSPKAKEVVYEIALAYEKHLQKHGGTTDNKLAWRILERLGKLRRYDAIVIDEFQDLSEVQFKAVVSLIKPSYPLPLFIYGDENQAINPTIFSYSDASIILHQLFGDDYHFHEVELNDSFRSGPNLVHYINDVNKVKRQAIGARRQEEELEISLREDEEDLFATLVEGKENLPKLIKLCADSDKDVVFIFPSVLRKEQAFSQYKSLAPAFVESAFLSVEEAKGREWDSVVLVDFFFSSSALFEAMLGEERSGHHSTVHRMLFNRFYVALTRARNRIVVYESSVAPLVRKKMLTGLTRLKDLDSLRSYFQGSVGEGAWLDFGKRLLKERKYDASYRAFSRAKGDEAEEYLALSRQYLRIERDEAPFEEAVDFCLSQLDYPMLKQIYDEQGHFDRCSFLDLALNPDAEASYVYEAYRSIEAELGEKERGVYSSLVIRCYLRRIDALI